MATPGDSRNTDVLSQRERLVGRIAAQIRRQGYYLSYIEPRPTQAIIDLRWAAQVAGRTIGRPTRTYTSATGTQRPGLITVIVAPTETRTAQETELREKARAMIEMMLERHSVLREGPRTA